MGKTQADFDKPQNLKGTSRKFAIFKDLNEGEKYKKYIYIYRSGLGCRTALEVVENFYEKLKKP